MQVITYNTYKDGSTDASVHRRYWCSDDCHVLLVHGVTRRYECKDYAMQARLATLQIPGVVAALSLARSAEVCSGEGLAGHTLSYTTALQGLFQPAPPLPASTSPCNGLAHYSYIFCFWHKTFLSKENIKRVPFQQIHLLLVGVLTRTFLWGPWHTAGLLWHSSCVSVRCEV